MNAKLPVALGLLAVLVLPALAQSWTERSSIATQASGAVAAPAPLLADLQTSSSTAGPSRGMTMAQVEERHGAPTIRRAPVGNPPITRWEYESFIVYFEYRHVIHSVAKLNQ
ncbi:MAG: hypothetical protein AB8G18_09825 [Gammaproteobacteria bacterium]